uniref:Uncharacterized protein n=1 Tax=Anguilla anguilla TaxID=7936 RepID=A0A0E9T0X2_ANGAN
MQRGQTFFVFDKVTMRFQPTPSK